MQSSTDLTRDLTYHNQLMVLKAIQQQTQLELIEKLIKTGVLTAESVNLVTSLYMSFRPTDQQKQIMKQLINQYIFHDITKNALINLITINQ
jgi:hypothetical protein